MQNTGAAGIRQLTRKHSTDQQSVPMWEMVKWNLQTATAEQNILYMHHSHNLMLLQHKGGDESADGTIMFENHSALAPPVQPMPNLMLCTLAYEVVALRFSR